MKVRFATREDIPRLLRLLQQVGQTHHALRPDLFRPDAQKYDAPALEALLQDPQRPILVAGAPVAGYAFCILRAVENDPVLRDRRELYLDDLCVDEDHRGQGIATALFEAVRALAVQRQCQAVTLNVWCGNSGAQKLYEKLGMKPQKIGMEMPLEDSLCW